MNTAVEQFTPNEAKLIDVVLLISDIEQDVLERGRQDANPVEERRIPAPHIAPALDDDTIPRLRFQSYTMRAAALRQILEMPGCVGISLQYGVDDSGELQIFPIGVDGDGRGIADTAVPAEARRFIGRYTGTVKSHFFGRGTFTRLLEERRSEAVRVTPAFDDDRAPQLILSDATEKEPRIYEDASYPCRSACPSQPN